MWHTGRVPEQYIRKPNTQCSVCNAKIYRRPADIKRRNGRVFCSMRCYGLSCRKEIPCIICKKPILSRYNKKTCSRSCANKHRTGIKYLIGRPKDKVTTQRALKMGLLKLRGSSCERCGYSKYEILQVHHKDRVRANNNFDNLELICPNCHYEEHYLENSWINKYGGVG